MNFTITSNARDADHAARRMKEARCIRSTAAAHATTQYDDNRPSTYVPVIWHTLTGLNAAMPARAKAAPPRSPTANSAASARKNAPPIAVKLKNFIASIRPDRDTRGQPDSSAPSA